MVLVDAVASVNCFSVMSTAVNKAPKLDSPKRRHVIVLPSPLCRSMPLRVKPGIQRSSWLPHQRLC